MVTILYRYDEYSKKFTGVEALEFKVDELPKNSTTIPITYDIINPVFNIESNKWQEAFTVEETVDQERRFLIDVADKDVNTELLYHEMRVQSVSDNVVNYYFNMIKQGLIEYEQLQEDLKDKVKKLLDDNHLSELTTIGYKEYIDKRRQALIVDETKKRQKIKQFNLGLFGNEVVVNEPAEVNIEDEHAD